MQILPAPIHALESQAVSYPTHEPIVAPRPFGGFWSRLIERVTQPRRGATYAALAALSDRDLRDIGLTRGEIGQVYDPEFCARRVLRARSAG